jgi:S-adenosyl methyltransferase
LAAATNGSRVSDEPIDPAGAAIDTTRPHSARIWNHWLGGTDNYPADRAAGDAVAAADPQIRIVARASRAFLGRTVRFLAGEAGVRQFLDVGSGLPTAGNTHQVAQEVAADSRVVYVDHDPLVQTQAKFLLAGTEQGVTRFIDADMYDPSGIVRGAAEVLDLRRPVAVLFVGSLGLLPDLDEARDIVKYLMARTCPGSYLVVNDGARLVLVDVVDQARREHADAGARPYTTRTPEEIESFFEGLEFVEPGFVPITRWRPDDGGEGALGIAAFGGVGRKP